jgi:hypothetical protein
VLVDYPSFDDVVLVDTGTGTTIGTFNAADPSAPPSTLPPVSWTSSLSPDGGTVATFDLAGRGYAFDTADGHLLTGLTGGHTSLVSDSYFNDAGLLLTASVDGSLRMWDPRASETEVSGDLSDNLCREFGSRIDADSWELAFEGEAIEPPCPAMQRPAPAPLQVSSSADVGSVPEVSTPRTVAFQDTFDGASSFRTGEQQLSTGTVSTEIRGGRYRMEVSGVGVGYTAWQSAATSGAGSTWAVSATQGRSRGECGLYVTDGTSQVTVTLDRDAASGTLAWFSQVDNTHNEPFAIPVGASGELSLVDDGGVMAVLLGGRRVATVVDPVLRAPSGVGAATHGDAASCDFDDITLTTTP